MQEYTFLPEIGEDPKAFWREVNAQAEAHEADRGMARREGPA